LLQWCQARIIAQQRLEEGVRTRGRQRIEPQLRVIRLAAPAVLILRAVVDQEQELRRRQTLNQLIA
jgi:hypothetical protein